MKASRLEINDEKDHINSLFEVGHFQEGEKNNFQNAPYQSLRYSLEMGSWEYELIYLRKPRF